MARLKGGPQFVYGMLVAVTLVACAGASFPFRHYTVEMPAECYEQGKLLAPQAENDLPFSTCQPDENDKFKCTVYLTEEFQRLKKSYLDTQAKLEACEREQKQEALQ